jgi:KAP family P-loop domain
LPLLMNVMAGVRAAGFAGLVVNCSYPDVTHPVLACPVPTLDVGNAGMIEARVRAGISPAGRQALHPGSSMRCCKVVADRSPRRSGRRRCRVARLAASEQIVDMSAAVESPPDADGSARSGADAAWDLSRPLRLGLGHTGPVRALATVALPDGPVLLASAGADHGVVLWPLLPSGRMAGESISDHGALRSASGVDDEAASDVLGRGILAAHLEELLFQLTEKQRAGTAVLHVDGRWGSGKSTLVNLFVRRLSVSDGRSTRLRDPIVVRYDAWRESAVAPEWWSLATAIHRAVRAERALAVRWLMTALSAVRRTVRSGPVVVAGLVLIGAVAAWASGIWTGNVEVVSKTVTALAAVVTLGLAAGRVLFWSSPAFARIHLRSDDNPLGEVAAVVSWLRRWSPLPVRGQRGLDTGLAVVVLAAVTWVVFAYATDPVVRTHPAAVATWVGAHALPLAAALVAVVLVVGSWRARAAPGGSLGTLPTGATGRGQLRPVRRPRRLLWRLRYGTRRAIRPLRRFLTQVQHGIQRRMSIDAAPELPYGWLARLSVAVVVAASAYLMFMTPTSPPLRTLVHGYPELTAAGIIALGFGLYAVLTSGRSPRRRRPLLLVLDDLDRCTADRVVKLLETVHTLLREPARLRVLAGRRAPAPLIVVVLADGRWVRKAFETSYSDFGSLGSPVHDLGADFLQKVFDHVVLVPGLSGDQVQSYLDAATGTTAWAVAERSARSTSPVAPEAQPVTKSRPEIPEPPSVMESTPSVESTPPAAESSNMDQPVAVPARTTDPAATDQADDAEKVAQLIDRTAPGDVHGSQVPAALDQVPPAQREQLAEQIATKAATPEAVAAFSEHLLTRYAAVMPANPRLVKRVANTFGMLHALGLHLAHHEDDDTISRAAIMFVRFPTLVDQLLSDPEPPSTQPGPGPAPEAKTPWQRPDVQQLLTRDDGTAVDITGIARCFGRQYPPAPPLSDRPSPNGRTPAVTPTIKSKME